MPYKNGGLAHVKYTVLWAVLPEVIFFSLVALAVCLISQYVHPLQISPTMITVFGAVNGFLVSFRTSSAWSSYTEGRRYWSSIILASRTFARITWLHVPNCITPPPADEPDKRPSADEQRRAIVEKKSVINLITAFSIATKHYCRGEAGIHYEDLYPLVAYLPRWRMPSSSFIARPDLDFNPSTTFDPTALETLSASALASFSASASTVAARSPLMSRQGSSSSAFSDVKPNKTGATRRDATWRSIQTITEPLTGDQVNKICANRPLLPSRNPPPVSWDDMIPFWALFCDILSLARGRARKIRDDVLHQGSSIKKKRLPLQKTQDGDNVPLELILLLSGWVASLQRRKVVDVATINGLLNPLQSLADSLTGLERVLLSPIPLAYSLHLRHVIWLWLLLLPAQLHANFGWLPLGYDSSDIVLEEFTNIVTREMRELTSHSPSETEPEQFIFVDENLPFATEPAWEGKSARDIVEQQVAIETIEAQLRGFAGQNTTSFTFRP
ncbi:hypothetical protein OIO90_003601 [Microbotryomycetes sp. JL221]|nr:hypothetical protein OIO90_003601 [Microbotryomycetes sp. JL221]